MQRLTTITLSYQGPIKQYGLHGNNDNDCPREFEFGRRKSATMFSIISAKYEALRPVSFSPSGTENVKLNSDAF